jgi:3-methyladenine DNA glycosylase Tag
LKLFLGDGKVCEQKGKPPKWIYREKRPTSDDVYFENMTKVVFLAGLNWRIIDEKWSNFKKAFHDFSIAEVARFDEKDVKRLIGDAGIVRNKAKIIATIHNAKQLQNTKKEYDSFQSYLDSLDKSNNYASVIKELGKKFSRLGPASARIFLYSVGERIDP